MDDGEGARNEATFLRHYELPASYKKTRFQGGLDLTDNGTWLISWSHDTDLTLTEVDPRLGSRGELLNVRMARGDALARSYRSYRESDLDLPLDLPSRPPLGCAAFDMIPIESSLEGR